VYQNVGGAFAVAGGGAAAGLANTGMNVVWLVLAAFALISAGSALMRISPKREG